MIALPDAVRQAALRHRSIASTTADSKCDQDHLREILAS